MFEISCIFLTGIDKSLYMKKSLLLIAVLGWMTLTAAAQHDAGNNPVLGEMQQSITDPSNQPGDSARSLIGLVSDATDIVLRSGESAFSSFREPGSRWRQGETYVFVLDLAGLMLVHPDPALEGKYQLDLNDIHGKPVIRGLIAAATRFPGKNDGWYHYLWPKPGSLEPVWKSSYVRRVRAPSGKNYIVGCGMYTERMEPEFVVDLVVEAVAHIGRDQEQAFPLLYDPKGIFRVKDAYVFVIDETGVDLVNPGFPSLEGRNILDLKDSKGKFLIREMFQVVKQEGSGWVHYMWPRPGESVATQKSTFVSSVHVGDKMLLVGCGVYLANAPKDEIRVSDLSAPALINLVRDAAVEFSVRGQNAYPDFRKQGSKWFKGDTYFFVWSPDGIRKFHAADPSGEGKDVSNLKDVMMRPFGKMILQVATTASGEGWVHYLYPEPHGMFPFWKSAFIKKVRFPDGRDYLIGCGIYHMSMDKIFIEDVVNRAAHRIAIHGPDAFTSIRDPNGEFNFMSTSVFVYKNDGTELINAYWPAMEGRNLIEVKDLKGRLYIREQIEAAVKNGQSWYEYYTHQPGDNLSAVKHNFVKSVRYGNDVFVVGAGYFPGVGKGLK